MIYNKKNNFKRNKNKKVVLFRTLLTNINLKT